MARTNGATAQRRPAARKTEEPVSAAPKPARAAPKPSPAAAATPKPGPVAAASPKPAAVKTKTGVAETVTKQSVVALRAESVRKLYRETVAEMKKINWPDRQTTKSLTILVIGISVVLGILLGGIDFLLLRLLRLF